MGERHSELPRAIDDWYVEPDWVAADIFKRVKFKGPIHDPCCGMGVIPDAAERAGIVATAADIKNRMVRRKFKVKNYFADDKIYCNIVTNPPFKLGQRIVNHALTHIHRGGRLALVSQLKFLASQGRYDIFENMKGVEKVIIYSRRPSMPPGEALLKHGEVIRGGGSLDFCWIVWRVGFEGKPTIEWSMGE